MSVEMNVPEIRFKGFSDEWEKDKLGQVYNFQYGEFNNNPSNGGQYPVYGANGIIGGYTRFNAKSSAVIGHMGEYAGSVLWAEGEHFVTYNGTIAKPKKSDFNPLFGYFSLVKMNLKKICGGSGQPFLSYDALERLDFIFPSESEQTAIGNTFQKLDNLINQHQQKHDKLSNIKKAMLEKMFPKQGETMPEIRFKGFSGEWEEKTLGELGETFTGLAGKTKHDFGHGQARFVTYMNVFANAISNESLVEPVEIDESQNEVVKGDVFFTTSSETPEEVGMSSIWMGEAKNVYLNSFCFGYRPKQKIDSVYLAYMLRASSFRKQVIFLAQGVSRYNISKTKVMDIKTYMPSLLEQEKIGRYFQKLDALINQHQQQITKLNNIKQACLSKMFV